MAASELSVFILNDAGIDPILIYDFNYFAQPTAIDLNDLLWDLIPWTTLADPPIVLTPDVESGPIVISGVSASDNVSFGWRTVWDGETCEVRSIFQNTPTPVPGSSS